jgi:leucyl aminopeptidase
MKTSVSSAIPKNQLLVLFAFEKESEPCGINDRKELLQLAAAEGFKGKENSTVIIHPENNVPAKQIIFTGLGDRKKCTGETIRRASAAAAKKAAALDQKSVSLYLPLVLGDTQKESLAAAEGSLLAAYKFIKYKSEKNNNSELQELILVSPESEINEAKKGLRLAEILTDASCFVRDLVNEPPSCLTPAKMAEHAKTAAKQGKGAGISVQIFEKKQIEKMKMGALLGVNRGSAEPPVFIHLRYKPANAKKRIALVGKGITFDSGGLSLKPAQSMETMKMDMAGAGTILGIFKVLPLLKPRVEVHGILAVTENMPGGRAAKPGDVFQAMNGKTIEVLNTDAEGRLILSDALSYAVKQNPDVIIDIATLTGACITALGSLVAGAMGNEDQIFKDIQKASEQSGEKFWQLPLVPDYKEGMKSSVADIKNISSARGEGGAIIGGLFLQEFTDNKPWIHLDIAGPAWSDKEHLYYSAGGTGFPTRTLLHYLLNI